MDRCPWPRSEIAIRYHDEEWGVPVHDDRKHFEFLMLEAAQAGLSWEIVLRKREGYRVAFAEFDPEAVAKFDADRVDALVLDPGIVRNRKKIEAAVGNARAFLRVRDEFGSFDTYLWQFVEGHPVMNAWERIEEVPARTPLSDAVSADLRQRDFRFVGSTICYAHLQATGLLNDHLVSCFRHAEIRGDVF